MNAHDIINAEIPLMQGWCELDKAHTIFDLITGRKLGLCVEVGVFGGRSFLPAALAVKENGLGHAFGIDPWDNKTAVEGVPDIDREAHEKWWQDVPMEDIFSDAQSALVKHGLPNRWASLLRGRAQDMVSWFGSIDYLHIDGNHSREDSCRDVDQWCRKVRCGGIILVDDIDWPTVAEAQEKVKRFGRFVGTVARTAIVERE